MVPIRQPTGQFEELAVNPEVHRLQERRFREYEERGQCSEPIYTLVALDRERLTQAADLDAAYLHLNGSRSRCVEDAA